MAPNSIDTRSSTSATGASHKRKLHTQQQQQRFESESEDEDLEESDEDNSHTKGSGSNKTSASQQLVPVPGNPDAPLVTKRTLQNRKAQREFRKRREARVRELEERCRRFDQMGLESNADLQRIAQQLKDENEALKSHVAGLGFAHTIPALLDSVAASKARTMPAQHYPTLDLSMESWARGSDAAASRQSKNAMSSQPMKDTAAHSKASKRDENTTRSSLAHQPVFAGLLPAAAAKSSSVNPSMLSDSRVTASKVESSTNDTFDNDWFAQLAQSGHDKEEAGGEHEADAQRDAAAPYNPILSLNFAGEQQKKQSNVSNGAPQQSTKQPEFSTGNGQSYSGGYGNNNMHMRIPMPMPTQQNGALLNPNPIPFAFNLSDPKAAGDQSWWSQMYNNQLPGDDDTLDEKAQAVAQATGMASQGGAPSPFDLSAFLNGGMTPGGMFSFGGQQSDGTDNTQKQGDDAGKASGSAVPKLTQAEHAQMFLRLLEAKMAKGSTSPYAQLGFQPPSHQQHQQQQQQQQQQIFSPLSVSSSESGSKSRSEEEDGTTSALSPINIYSRLSQHPAFLSTNASELEELVDSIGGTRQATRKQSSTNRGTPLHPSTPSTYAGLSSSPASQNMTNGVEVDETAVSKMLGLLDRKSSRDTAQVATA